MPSFINPYPFESRITFGQWLEKQLLANFPDFEYYIGIGRKCDKLEDYKFSYNEALKSVEIAIALHRTGPTTFSSLGSYSLFFESRDREKLIDFSLKHLGPLYEYDRLHQGELVYSLEDYLHNGCNLALSAKHLHLSENGMRYRLQKIEKILGISIDDNNTCFDLQMSLHIALLFRDSFGHQTS